MEEVEEDDDEEALEGMTQADIREYYAKKVQQRLAKMDPLEQQAMFKRFSVSSLNFISTNS